MFLPEDAMKLKEYAGVEKVITFGSIRGKYDVYINESKYLP